MGPGNATREVDRDNRTAVRAHARGRLPGELMLDIDLVERAVQELNRIHSRKGLEKAVAMAKWVVDNLFGGSIESWRAKRSQHRSLRRISKHPGLACSHSYLSKALAVLANLERLPQDLRGAPALSLSHHYILSGAKDQALMVHLARTSVQRGWSREALSEELEQHPKCGKPLSGAGRPCLPAGVKELNRISKALAGLRLENLEERSLRDHLGSSKLEQMVDDVEGLLHVLRCERVRRGEVVLASDQPWSHGGEDRFCFPGETEGNKHWVQ